VKTRIILLWDIDGTLISAHGSGTAALSDSLKASFGIESTLDHIEIQGRTDRWIYERMLRAFELPVTQANMDLLERNYLDALIPQIQARGVDVLPGINAILEEAHRRGDVAQGLLTGNLIEGARRKMSGLGLMEYFPFGAFADDAANRNELGPKAVERARRHVGEEVPLERIWVIGDTPHDVTCGKTAGARTLAIATGKVPLQRLQECSPCAAFEDLSDTDAFWRAVES